MSLPRITTRVEWLAARTALLAKEKAATRARDELNAERRRLPMVEIDKDYAFTGPNGPARLIDLFEGRRQLIVYHFMFAPEWDEGCPSCSAGADEMAPGVLDHLHGRDTSFVYVSRAPQAKLAAYRQRKGWVVPWYSSYGSDFNYDFHVTLDESVTPIEYNFRPKDEWRAIGGGWLVDSEQPFDLHGHSCFLRDGERVFHTYSMYGRGAETASGSYYLLDLTALGRQEDWEEPKGRSGTDREARPDFTT